MALYAEAFEQVDRLDRLETFTSERGPDCYELPRNPGQITLARIETPVPATFPFGDDVLVPMRAGETTRWQVAALET